MGKSSAASSSSLASGSDEPRQFEDQHGVYVETSPRSYTFVSKTGEAKGAEARTCPVLML